MTRNELLEPIVSTIRNGLPLTKQDVLNYLESWEVIPVKVGEEHAVTVIVKGTELHLAQAPNYELKGSLRGVIRGFLKPLLERHGFLTTRIQHQRLAQKRFVQRAGFKPTWKDDQFEYYMLTSMPFERKHS